MMMKHIDFFGVVDGGEIMHQFGTMGHYETL